MEGAAVQYRATSSQKKCAHGAASRAHRYRCRRGDRGRGWRGVRTQGGDSRQDRQGPSPSICVLDLAAGVIQPKYPLAAMSTYLNGFHMYADEMGPGRWRHRISAFTCAMICTSA